MICPPHNNNVFMIRAKICKKSMVVEYANALNSQVLMYSLYLMINGEE